MSNKSGVTLRRQAREYALQFLYQLEFGSFKDYESPLGKQFNHQTLQLFFQEYVNGLEKHPKDQILQFTFELVSLCAQNYDELLKLIEQNLKNWSISRLAAIDRALLLLACTELIFIPSTPKTVVINEALEMAKKYSNKDSKSFINGVLDKLKDAKF